MGAPESAFYVTGGTLRHDAPSYVERQADKDLLEGLVQSEFCYVLTSRQMGKSSLMVRAAGKLREQSAQVVVLDLTAIGQNLTPEQWYDGLILSLGRQVKLEDELESFWRAHARYSPVQRFFAAIRDFVLPLRDAAVVVFVDELDMVRSLPFKTDEFFAAIRECYSRRTQDAEFSRLTFCLLGVATPSELIRDPRITPFNIGRRIELTDFTLKEAGPLAHGLANPKSEIRNPKSILDRILHWTNGHPYLTQRLCRAVVETFNDNGGTEGRSAAANESPAFRHSAIPALELVDSLCDDLFLSPRARERDDNLLYVRERILRAEVDLAELLNLYQRIRSGERVRDDETSDLINQLRLAGLTRMERRYLAVRNLIYRQVFDDDWIKANWPRPPVARASGAVQSVAVLPFVNMSSEPENEFLSDGITEDLITALSKVPGLRVPARTSSFAFKQKNEDIRKIGQMLSVTHVVEGSVQKARNRLRITAQLINVTDGFHLWSDRYDREMQDVFAIQDEITRSIVDALKVELVGDRTAPLVKRQTESTEAYQLYLKGRELWYQRGVGLKKALRYFELALLEDPNYALGYSGLADTHFLLGFYGYTSPAESVPAAKAAVWRAREIDPALPEVHLSYAANNAWYEWDFAASEHAFKRAMELNPNYALAHTWYASLLCGLGRHDAAIAAATRATEIDPLSPYTYSLLGWMLVFARRNTEAMEPLRRALELAPDYVIALWLLGLAHVSQSRLEEGIAAMEKAAAFSSGASWIKGFLAHAYATAGHREKALTLLEELSDPKRQPYVRPFLRALGEVGLGNTERALDLLHQAYSSHEMWLPWLNCFQAFDPVGTHPRFLELLRKIGLEK